VLAAIAYVVWRRPDRSQPTSELDDVPVTVSEVGPVTGTPSEQLQP
jgi:hypothetical protein